MLTRLCSCFLHQKANVVECDIYSVEGRLLYVICRYNATCIFFRWVLLKMYRFRLSSSCHHYMAQKILIVKFGKCYTVTRGVSLASLVTNDLNSAYPTWRIYCLTLTFCFWTWTWKSILALAENK